jgi:hypothetical protein
MKCCCEISNVFLKIYLKNLLFFYLKDITEIFTVFYIKNIPEIQAEHFSPLQAAQACGQARQKLTAWAGRVRSGHTSTHVEMCSRWSG